MAGIPLLRHAPTRQLSGQGRGPRPGRRRSRGLAAGVAAATALAVAVTGAPPAGANPGDTSQGSARFLSGSLLLGGVSLDSVAALGGVSAANTGGASVVTQANTLSVGALGANLISLPGGISVPLSTFLQLGAVNQYAQAGLNSVSRAAAGAVDNSGAVDTTGSGAFPSSASIDLVGLLGNPSTVLTTGRLAAQLITAVAARDGRAGSAPATTCTDLSAPVNCRDYSIGTATVDLVSPLVGDLVATINTALGTLSNTLNTTLETSLVTGLLGEITTVVNTIGLGLVSLGTSTIAATVSADLVTALSGVLSSTLDDGVVSINLATGAIHVDLSAITGALNNLAPNTSVLTAGVITDLTGRVTSLLTGLQTALATALNTALNAVTATISGSVELIVAALPVASLTLSYNGTLGDLASGTAVISVVGGGVLGPLADIVAALLLSLPGIVDGVVSPVLATGLSDLATVASGAVSTLTTALYPVLNALPDVLGLTANVQEAGATVGSYREVALRATVLSGGATLDVARVEVGANGQAAAPTLSGLVADHGPLAGGNQVTVNGTGFFAGTTVTFDGAVITPDSISSDFSALVFTVPPGTVSGPVVVTVSNANGTTAPGAYTYDPPTLTATGPVRPGDDAPVASTGWPPNTVVTVQLSKSGTPVGSPITVTTTAAGAFPAGTTIPVPSDATLGTYTVTGTDAAGDHASDTLNLAAVAAVFAASLSPTSGPEAGGQTVTVRGGGFGSDSVVTIGGNTVTPKSIDPNGLWLTFVTPPHTPGPVDVTVASQGLTTDPMRYTYLPAPHAQTIDPDRGPVSGGQLVTITGAHFTADAVVTIGGKTVTPQFIASDGTSLTFITPSHPAGPVSVTVTTAGGTSGPLTYTYVPDEQLPPPPVITDPPDGGTVTDPTPPISGTGEPGGTVVVIEGGVVLCTADTAADGTWTCTPSTDLPAGSHTITAQQTVGRLTSGLSPPVTFTVVTDWPNLETTGADVRGAGVAGLLLVIAGFGLLAAGWSWRRRVDWPSA